ncbi:MAG TPA: NAD(P)-dependent oxidoreductase [Candidatus Binataceae bacterium]|nr:NAD(P)-dependent oxidoreductase [Candidatus Binataceae bacterium]
MDAKRPVGFIGLGTMGAKMAASLQRAGYPLVVHDIRAEAASPHLAAGAKWADTPRQVAESTELVFTSLPAPPDVEAVALGPQGVLAGMKPDGAYFDLSTNSPALVRRLCSAFAERRAHMLDAPVSGGPQGAATGKLAIWVGGERDVFDRYQSVLDAIGDQARYVGPIGSATVAKLVHNCAGYMLQRALSEVFTMGAKAGVEPLTLWEAVRNGALGRARTFDGLARHFLPGIYDPPDFALRLAHKDVSLAVELGRETNVPMPIAALALDELTEALNRGWGERDSRVAMLLQEERAGVKFAVDPVRIREALDRDRARRDPKAK